MQLLDDYPTDCGVRPDHPRDDTIVQGYQDQELYLEAEANHRILEFPKTISIPDDGVKRRQKPNDVLLTDVLFVIITAC